MPKPETSLNLTKYWLIEGGSGKFDQRTVADDDVILSTVIFQENIGLAVKSEYTFIK